MRAVHLTSAACSAAVVCLSLQLVSAAAEIEEAAVRRALEAEAQRVEVVKQISAPTISVFGPGGGGGGSGVIVTPDGYALTNFHVVRPCGNFMKCGLNDGRVYDAVVVSVDPTGDVAMIKLLGRDDFPTATLGDSDRVAPGDWCYAAGNPFLLATNLQPSISYGIISGVHRYQYPADTLLEYTDCLQTDAAINPGNSGGPLFDAEGLLIGINGRCSFEKRGRVNVGVGYAISINQIKKFMGYLRSGRIVDHATLGATVTSDEGNRVIVSNILETSDVYRRGLRYGDELLTIGGRQINSVNGLKNVLGTFPRGWRIPLRYRRGAEVREILVRLSGVHSREELLAKVQAAAGEEDLPPGDEPDKKPRRPQLPLPQLRTPRKVSADLARHFESRRGYANYHFNRMNIDRVWQAYTRGGELPAPAGEWVVSTERDDGRNAEFILRDGEAFATLPDERFRIDLTEDLDTQLAPDGSGGLLLALSMWRRFTIDGPEKFGEVYYLGTMPIRGHSEPVDVLVGLRGAIETHFYFDPASAAMLGLEMFPEAETDPCEVYFESAPQNGGLRPQGFTVWFGDERIGIFQVQLFAD